MAEVKNAFIKSKMNKDLDARLLPSGEYRNAVNAQISRSEGADVGALENVLGNKLVFDFEPSVANLTSIGSFVDEVNNAIYIFLTDNTTSNYNITGTGSNHFIYKLDPSTSPATATKLVDGPFLNFSTISPIHGVNLLEELLFFTDNRNQPRKINVNNFNVANYYTTEDQISVAKYNPYESISLWQENASTVGEYETTMKDVVSLAYPDGGTCKTVAITSLSSFPVTDASFGDGIYIKALQKISYINSSGNLVAFSPAITVVSYTKATKVLVVSSAITLAAATTLVISPNPYYQSSYNGDPNFLTDKFVRFSYRFQFDDGEYSIMAPFTQPAFVPKQDGYFLNTETSVGDQQQTFESTVVDFMENKVNKINLRIPLPSTKSSLKSTFHITNLDILYKESDALAVQVIATVPIDTDFTGTETIFDYEYQAQKPYKTLPEKDIVRVYDKIPVKALSQEIISNRVVYGNFQDKHTPPATLDYNVNVTEKSAFDLQTGSASQVGALVSGTSINIGTVVGNIVVGSKITGSGIPTGTTVITTTNSPPTNITVSQTVTSSVATDFIFTPAGEDSVTTSIIEYPSSSVKTNRNYQIGVVLSDKFGRQSTTILSNNKTAIVTESQTYVGSTLYSPYIDSGTNPATWPGNSLKVLFNEAIQATPNPSQNYPGVYNGDVASVDYNPLGWYSYKIVVKQQEQEYYNVYTAGALKGNPTAITQDLSNSSIVLINDNINKVPRDLNEVGPTDRTFRSSVQLFGRVENILAPPVGGTPSYSNTGNQQYYPGQRSFTTNTIEDLFDSFDVAASLVNKIDCAIYKFEGSIGTEVAYVACGNEPNITIWTAAVGDLETEVCANTTPGPFINSGTPTITLQPNSCKVNIPITSTDNPFHAFFRAESDPFVAYMTTSQIGSQQFGVVNTAAKPFITVENLAILETEPTESRLDIFWETSTAGLINELNNLILNDTGGGSGFSDFNSSNFTEAAGGAEATRNVLSSNFSLVDNLGGVLDPTSYSSFLFTLDTVTSNSGQDNTSYFDLYKPIAGPANANIWNIKINDTFLNNIFYRQGSGNVSTSTSVWTFAFSWTLTDTAGDVTTGSSSKIVEMGNEPPVIYEFDGTTVATTPQNISIDFASTAVIKTLVARNGAYDGSTGIKNANTGTQLVWSLTAKKAVNGTEGDSTSLFTLQTPTVTSTQSQVKWNWNATGANIGYIVTIKVVDANDQDPDEASREIKYNISSGTAATVQNMKWVGECQAGDGQEEFSPCIITITGNATAAYNGFYIFADPFEDLPVVNGNVTLNWTGAYKGVDTNGVECGREATGYGGLMFSTSYVTVFNYWDGNNASQDCSGCGQGSGSEVFGGTPSYPITVDVTNISFNFI